MPPKTARADEKTRGRPVPEAPPKPRPRAPAGPSPSWHDREGELLTAHAEAGAEQEEAAAGLRFAQIDRKNLDRELKRLPEVGHARIDQGAEAARDRLRALMAADVHALATTAEDAAAPVAGSGDEWTTANPEVVALRHEAVDQAAAATELNKAGRPTGTYLFTPRSRKTIDADIAATDKRTDQAESRETKARAATIDAARALRAHRGY